ncbi:hypothetical protein GCM10008938_24290 [Deinococcus roseus]|uniref:Uncharacterized protein n=1 Tax=Deinococcus roseus TaxID=392414 RepID=A0ABQ2CZY4_9DEIO|nr:hypothetical protein GCM10008938_24290 [Deinococcus roseus]
MSPLWPCKETEMEDTPYIFKTKLFKFLARAGIVRVKRLSDGKIMGLED